MVGPSTHCQASVVPLVMAAPTGVAVVPLTISVVVAVCVPSAVG